MQYSYTVMHCSGKDNIVADFFSRNPEGKFFTQHETTLLIAALQRSLVPNVEACDFSFLSFSLVCFLKAEGLDKARWRRVGELQKEDEKIKRLFEALANGKNSNILQIYNEILFHREKNTENWRIEKRTHT